MTRRLAIRKEIVTVDEARGIVRVTTADERWYVRESTDPATGLPTHEYVPSVTWIARHYPKGIAFHKWLAQHGWDESQAIKQAAGDKGSKVHQAISRLLDGEEIVFSETLFGTEEAEPSLLTWEETDCVRAFADWLASLSSPVVLAKDLVVWGPGYAGTIDLVYSDTVAGVTTYHLVDFKTGQHVWPEYELQLTAYRQALPEGLVPEEESITLGILQVGYRANKKGWKYTRVDYQPALFAAARLIWEKETEGQQPHQKDYPLRLRLKL